MQFNSLPSIFENLQLATRLGFTREECAVHPTSRRLTSDMNLFVGGRFWTTPALNCAAPGDYDLSDCGAIKIGALAGFEAALITLREIDAEVRRINSDSRYSDTGRTESRRKLFESKWIGLGRFSKGLAANFADLERWLNRYCSPGARGKDDMAGALLDMEYRAVVRAMFDGDGQRPNGVRRARHLKFLQLDNPNHPVVLAVLRADPLASGLTAAQIERMRLVHGVQVSPDAVRSIWSTACALDALAHVLFEGTQRAAMLCDSLGDWRVRDMQQACAEGAARENLRRLLDSMTTDALWAAMSADALEEAEDADEAAKTDPTKALTADAQGIGAEREGIEAEQQSRNGQPAKQERLHSGNRDAYTAGGDVSQLSPAAPQQVADPAPSVTAISQPT